MSGLNLASSARVSLLRTLLHVFTVEEEVIPVDIPSLEDAHQIT